MLIDVHYESHRPQFAGLFVRHAAMLAEHGYTIRERRDCVVGQSDADAIIAQHKFVRQIDRPTILCERRDGATLNDRRWIDDERVKAVLKLNVLNPAKLQDVTFERHHATLLGEVQPKSRALTDAELAKIRVAPNYAVYDKLAHWLNVPVDIDADRPVSVHFRGKVRYHVKSIQGHRRRCLSIVKSIPGAIASEAVVTQSRFIDELKRSRIVVSPWGYGETCYRDIEAMYAGCVLVKPNSGHVETLPRLFGKGDYVACRHDLADLADVIAGIDWEDTRAMRIANRERMLGAWGECGEWCLETLDLFK